jgi:hypothetical protein
MAWKRFSFVSDAHGDQIDKTAEKAFFRFVADFKPQIRIFGGDLWDMRPLRRGADEEEKREALKLDFDAGMEFAYKYKPTNMLLGNHDHRLYNLAENGYGITQEYAKSLVSEATILFDKLKCPVLPYDKRKGVLSIGKMNCIHGFTSGPTAARKSALVYGNVLMGHTHGISSCTIEGLDDRTGRICGCLVTLDMPYNSMHMGALQHRHGWGMGVINDKTGIFHFSQVEGVGGRFISPTGFKEV